MLSMCPINRIFLYQSRYFSENFKEQAGLQATKSQTQMENFTFSCYFGCTVFYHIMLVDIALIH